MIPYLIANLAAMLLMVASFKAPKLARFGFMMLFAVACWYNVTTVLATPAVYTDFDDLAILRVYRWFISGPFHSMITPVVLTIAAGQAFIAMSMPLSGRLFTLGCLAGVVFCLGIFPLGWGSAIPAPAFLAIGFYRLYRQAIEQPGSLTTDHPSSASGAVTSQPADEPLNQPV